jgi:hypothetical protein
MAEKLVREWQAVDPLKYKLQPRQKDRPFRPGRALLQPQLHLRNSSSVLLSIVAGNSTTSSNPGKDCTSTDYNSVSWQELGRGRSYKFIGNCVELRS